MQDSAGSRVPCPTYCSYPLSHPKDSSNSQTSTVSRYPPPKKTTRCRINLRSIIQSVWFFMCWIRDETKELTHPSLVPIPRPTFSHSPSLAYSLLGPIPGPALILARWPCSEPGSPIYLRLVSQQTMNTNGNVNIVLILLWQRKEKSSKSIHHPAPLPASLPRPLHTLNAASHATSAVLFDEGRGREGAISFIILFGANINYGVKVTVEVTHKHWNLLKEIDQGQLRLSACFSVGFRCDIFDFQQSPPWYNYEIFSL